MVQQFGQGLVKSICFCSLWHQLGQPDQGWRIHFQDNSITQLASRNQLSSGSSARTASQRPNFLSTQLFGLPYSMGSKKEEVEASGPFKGQTPNWQSITSAVFCMSKHSQDQPKFKGVEHLLAIFIHRLILVVLECHIIIQCILLYVWLLLLSMCFEIYLCCYIYQQFISFYSE